MKSLWPDKFLPIGVKTVKQLLDEQSKILPKLTEGKVYAKVKPVEELLPRLPTPLEEITAIRKGLTRLDGRHTTKTRDSASRLRFSYLLMSENLKNYSFEVFEFSYGILRAYPVTITLDEPIAEELHMDKVTKVQSEEKLTSILGAIYQSDRLKEIIGSIMQFSL